MRIAGGRSTVHSHSYREDTEKMNRTLKPARHPAPRENPAASDAGTDGAESIRRPTVLWLSGLCLALSDADMAWAVQTHGAPEGLYAHQIGHLVFLVAMIYIWLRTHRRTGSGWRMIRLAFVFFAVWNINTFITHAIAAGLDPARFRGDMGPLSRYFLAQSTLDVYFFFGKMDHLLCIPAALFLGMGLHQMRRAVSGEGDDHAR